MNKAQLRLVKSVFRARDLYSSGGIKGVIARIIKFRNRVIYACDIGLTAKIPTDCIFHHSGLGVVIGNGVIMGNRCQIYSNVVIGSKELHGHGGANPIIGDDVVIGAGAIILGDIRVGNNAVIGAGSVVLKDVPENAMAAGNPAEIKSMQKRV